MAIREIRGALIMSTIAITISFAPLRFITGMMGPYMAPMAFNVPVSVTVSTLVAFLVTPWLSYKLLKPAAEPVGYDITRTGLYRVYAALLRPLLGTPLRSWAFLIVVAGLYPGMFGRLLIPIGQTQKLYLPAAAVSEVGQLNFVIVKTEQGNQRRYVRLGHRRSDNRIEVISGLKAGEQVLINQ